MNPKRENEDISEQELIGLVVHAYNNHLAAITGFNEIALLHSNQEKTEELLELSLKSAKQASYLGQSLLASVSRLQLELEAISIAEIVSKLIKLYPSVHFDVSCKDSDEIISQTEWLMDCITEMVEFLNRLAIVQERKSEIKIALKLNSTKQQMEMLVGSDVSSLEILHQTNLFNLYYSSKKMFGTAGVGLAKVKGFFNQTKASVEWSDGEGFVVVLPTKRVPFR
ncbi:MAG: hypothetical protein ABJI92_07915 [Kangiellaceae bacterium]